METMHIPITVQPNVHATETIVLSAGAQRIAIVAGRSSTLKLFCTGTHMAGSLLLDIQLEQGATVFVGIAGTVHGTDEWTITSLQNHTVPQATSRVVVRKVVYDAARAIYQGTIYIAPEASGSVVSQDDKTLLDGL